MDLMAVYAAAEEHLAYIREGNGPFFLEAITYRFRGHSMGGRISAANMLEHMTRETRYGAKSHVRRFRAIEIIGNRPF